MAHLITFTSRAFDIARERPNPINPIAGESLLAWLVDRLRQAGYDATDPEPEDWGWFIRVQREGAGYLVGASAEPADDPPAVWCAIQIHKHRSLKQRLTGANKLRPYDEVSAAIERFVRHDLDSGEITIDRES